MNKEKVKEILNAKLQAVENAAAAVAPRYSETSIHAFRVAVKKLRAYLRLLDTADDEPKMRLTKKFHHLYDIAGNIRDAQLKLKKTTKDKTAVPSYTTSLSAIISAGKQDWEKRYDEKILDKLRKKLESKGIRKLPANTLVIFCKEHIHVLEETADNAPADDRIHECRKSVKDILYNTKLAEKYWPKAYAKVAELPLTSLDHLSDLLGDYNDERQLLDSHREFLSVLTDKNERATLRTLSNKETKQKEAHRQVLLKELKRFITAASL